MELGESSSQFASFVRQHTLSLVLALIALLLFGYGLTTFISSSQKSPDSITFESHDIQATPNPTQESKQKEIVVDVAGAVATPGVYKLSADSRVQDAISAAGGVSSTADQLQIAKSLNLAARLTDGTKIYIPRVGETGAVSGAAVAGASNKTVNLNTADSTSLDSLPGVGKVTADKIISSRPYTDIAELLSKKVVSQSVYTKIKDLVTVY